MTPLIDIQECTIRFGERTVVSAVNLRAEAGAFIALIGPNGAGKSTLLRAIAGLIPVESGAIIVDGNNVSTMSAVQRAACISMVPQQTIMPTGFTVQDIVGMSRYAFRPWYAGPSALDEAAVAEAMHRCEVAAFAHIDASELSGGEQQRVAVARAIAQGTRILILDEATAHLDLHHQAAILRIARELTHRGVLVIAAMHDVNLAAATATHMMILDEGIVAAQGRPDDVLHQEILERVYRTTLVRIPRPDNQLPLFVLPSTTNTLQV